MGHERKRFHRAGQGEGRNADEVEGDRPRAEGGVADFGQPVAWASAMAENCAESNAGTRGKARRSEDDDDATMTDARWAASMAMSAMA